MGTPSSIKTDNNPFYISRHFKQFLQSFSIKHITGIPYNPQAQGIVEQAHRILKLQIKKKFKKGDTQEHYYLPYLKQTLLDSKINYSLNL